MKESGFQAYYKPPAAFFNWFWHGVSACLTEIRSKLSWLRKGSIPIVEATSTDGVAYTATVPDVTELYNGMMLTIIPNMTSTSKAITLNVNGLGDKMVRLPLSFNNAAMTTPRLDAYYTEGRPLTIQYDADYTATGGAWKTIKQRTSAQDLYGSVPVENGGTGAETAEDALANLGAASVVYVNEQVGKKASTNVYYSTLTASGWSGTAPYTQTAAASGILSTDVPFVDVDMSGATGSEAGATLQEAWGFVGRVTVSESGEITAYCYEEKPTVDIPLILKVVR